MKFDLSICIPTYNRSCNLKEALDSIISQLNEIEGKVEICISDNASADKTKELVEEYKNLYPYITYFRHDKNMGADKNYLKVVEIAHGKYCWYLGSDDIINAGAVKTMLAETFSENDIYLFNRTEYTPDMRRICEKKFMSRNTDTKVFELGTHKSMENYLKSCSILASVFSYLSSIVFKKEKWDAVTYDESFTGTAYSHVFMLLSILQNNSTLKYINKSFVSCRLGDTDSFSSNEPARIMLDITGYKKVFNAVLYNFPKKDKYYKKIMRGQYPLFTLLNSITDPKKNRSDKEKKEILECFHGAVYGKFQLKVLYIFSFPYMHLKAAYKRLLKILKRSRHGN
jgi:abequosyltransferase